MNQFPINDFGPRPVPMSNKMPMNPNIPTMGGMMPNMPNMPNMQNMPNMPNMSNMPNMPNIPPNMGNIPPNMPMGNMPNMQMPTMGNVPKNAGNEQATKITKIIRDRNIYESQVQKDPGSVKNLKSTFVQPMRFVLETKLRVPPSESGVLVGNYGLK